MLLVRVFGLGIILVTLNIAIAHPTQPICQSSVSDTDNDGWGWENDESCIVMAAETQCEDRGGYPWGWDPVNHTSCRLDAIEVDISKMQNAIVGSWVCEEMYLSTSNTWESYYRSTSDYTELPGALPGICQGRYGSMYTYISRYVFHASGDVSIQNGYTEFPACESNPAFTRYGGSGAAELSVSLQDLSIGEKVYAKMSIDSSLTKTNNELRIREILYFEEPLENIGTIKRLACRVESEVSNPRHPLY